MVVPILPDGSEPISRKPNTMNWPLNIRHLTSSMLDDTIAAIATPLGEAGLAVIRVSGAQALTISDRIFSPVGKSSLKPTDAASHTVQFGHVVHGGKTIDEVLLTVLRAPRTFTREDTVEITCHGGI